MFCDEQSTIPLNGLSQFFSIRSEKEGAPLLLYLHGGPGDAALPLVLKYQRELERHFTVVVWEQRGAGKSYYPFGPDGVTLEDFLGDLYALVNYLLARFHQTALYLVGHSWGSILGIKFIQAYPELIRAYIGCGQVVNMKKSCREAYEFALAHANAVAQKRLKGIDCSYTGAHWVQDLLFVTKQVVRHKGSLYGRTNYNDLIKPFLGCKYYSLPDLIRRQKGGIQSIRVLWPALMEINFEGQTRYQVPVIFIEGRYDSHVSSALARAYFETIETEKRFYWFERSCHFPQWSESGKFNQIIIDLLGERKGEYPPPAPL